MCVIIVIIGHNLEKNVNFPKICHFFTFGVSVRYGDSCDSTIICSVSFQRGKFPFSVTFPYTYLLHPVPTLPYLIIISPLPPASWSFLFSPLFNEKGLSIFSSSYTHITYIHMLLFLGVSSRDMISWDLFLVIHRCEFKFASSVMLLKIVILVKIDNLSKHKLSYENYLINIPYF